MDRSSAEFRNKGSTEEFEQDAIKHVSSRFTHFMMTSTACILIGSVAFCLLFFQTDTFVKIDRNSVTQDLVEPRTKVQSVVADTGISVPGVTGQTVGEGYYRYDEDAYNKLVQSGILDSDSKCKMVAALYLLGKDEYGLAIIAGLGGNIYAEGEPGQLQVKNAGIDDWNGPGTGIVIPTYANPVYVRNEENLKIIESRVPFRGVGVFQWTYIGWRQQLVTYYRKYLSSGAELSDDDIRAAEVEYILTSVLPAFPGIKSCTTARDACIWWQVNYEQFGGTQEERNQKAEQIYSLLGGN